MEADAHPFPGLDRSVREELLAQQSSLRRLAFGLVRDAHDAEDLAQDAWVRALESPPRDGSAVRAWFGRVLTNRLRQVARERSARSRRETLASRPEAVPGQQELVDRVEWQRKLVEEVLALEEPFRTAVILRYCEELSALEAARRLGVPAATVRSRVRRGLQSLRARLDERCGGDRTRWFPALLVLARVRREDARAGAGALGAPTLVAVVSAALLGLGAWFGVDFDRHERASGLEDDEARRAELQIEPLADVSPKDIVHPLDPAIGADRRAEIAPSTAGSSGTHAAEPTVRPIPGTGSRMVEAVFVDAAGAPVAGVLLSAPPFDETAAGAFSDAAGYVGLDLSLTSRRTDMELRYTRAGFASGKIEAVLSSEHSTHFGVIVLQAGGIVSGRVVDAFGAPVDGVLLWHGSAELPDVPEAQLRGMGDLYSLGGEPAFRVFARSGADGGFELAGVPLSAMRVWAAKPGFRFSWSEPVAPTADEPFVSVHLVLEPHGDADSIRGRVVDASGAPVAGATVNIRFSAEGFGASAALTTEEDGRFSYRTLADSEHSLAAWDPTGRNGEALLEGVRPGAGDILLRLGETTALDVLVVARESTPIEEFTLILSMERDGLRSDFPQGGVGPHPGGKCSLFAPERVFSLRVEAPGFVPAELGPFDRRTSPEIAGGSLVCELRRAGSIAGHVVSDRGPVADARVSLHAVRSETCAGRPGRLSCEPSWSGRTDSDGSFSAPVLLDGPFAVVVEHDDFAGGVSEDLQARVEQDLRGVEIRLSAGGSLEIDGSAEAGGATGMPVGSPFVLWNGEGLVRTGRIGLDGRALCDRLRPGVWHAAWSAVPLELGGVPGWTAILREGERTKLRLHP